MGRDTKDEREGTPTEADAAEVRRRSREVSRRLSELRHERRALEEVRDRLVAELEQLGARRAVVEEERRGLEARAREQEQRAAELSGELEGLRCALPLLRQRCAELQQAAEEREGDLDALETGLWRFRGEVHASDTALRLLHEAVARMDHKLLARGLKR